MKQGHVFLETSNQALRTSYSNSFNSCVTSDDVISISEIYTFFFLVLNYYLIFFYIIIVILN